MFLVIDNYTGNQHKMKSAHDVNDFLYVSGMEGDETAIANLTNNPFDFLIYGRFAISKENGRLLKEVPLYISI